METTIGRKIKVVQSDWGCVFLSKEFQDFLDQNDISQQFIQANIFHSTMLQKEKMHVDGEGKIHDSKSGTSKFLWQRLRVQQKLPCELMVH